MSKNDDRMDVLLRAKRNGDKIFYGDKFADELTTEVEDSHLWNLKDNEYKIRRRREFIIKIDDRDKKNPIIHSTENQWTASDFGRYENGEYILMREVYPEEMK